MKIAQCYNLAIIVDGYGGDQIDPDEMEHLISNAVLTSIRQAGRGTILAETASVVSVGTQFEAHHEIQ